MKITHNQVGQNLNLRDTAQTDKAGALNKESKLDKTDSILNADLTDASKVSISQASRDQAKIMEVVKKTPDVNEKRVAELQKLIDEGKYKIDAEAIADRMVDEHLKWE